MLIAKLELSAGSSCAGGTACEVPLAFKSLPLSLVSFVDAKLVRAEVSKDHIIGVDVK